MDALCSSKSLPRHTPFGQIVRNRLSFAATFVPQIRGANSSACCRDTTNMWYVTYTHRGNRAAVLFYHRRTQSLAYHGIQSELANLLLGLLTPIASYFRPERDESGRRVKRLEYIQRWPAEQ